MIDARGQGGVIRNLAPLQSCDMVRPELITLQPTPERP